jgi:hypothetical protein
MKIMRSGISVLLFISLVISINAQEIAKRIPFLDGERWGFANPQGEVVIEAEYDMVWPFYKGAAKVTKNKFYGLIDTDGRMIVPLALEDMGEWREDMIRFSKGGKNGFYTSKGIRAVSPRGSVDPGIH